MTPLRFNAECRLSDRMAVGGSFEQPRGCFNVTCLFGPSGAGKTTILRMLAGLQRPTAGVITFGDVVWFDAGRGIDVPPQRRRAVLVDQKAELFPHLSAEENVAFGTRRLPSIERRRRIDQAIADFDLADLRRRRPAQLSGGERQRTALARAVAFAPDLLLLDEPFTGLDRPARDELRNRLPRMLARFSVPVLLVTHDATEAFELADRIILIEAGVIIAQGDVDELLRNPTGPRAASLLGVETYQPGRVIRDDGQLAEIQVGMATVRAASRGLVPGADCFVGVNGTDVLLVESLVPHISARNQLTGRIAEMTARGGLLNVAVDVGFTLTATVTRAAADELALEPGKQVVAMFKASAVGVIPRKSRSTGQV